MRLGANATEEMDCEEWASLYQLLWSLGAQESQGPQKQQGQIPITADRNGSRFIISSVDFSDPPLNNIVLSSTSICHPRFLAM